MTSSLLPTYARYPLAFAKGEGCWLETADGERYLDLGGGIAVASLGYSHPHLVQALTEQAGKLWHTSNLFQIPEAERLGERLCAASFADYVFFANSGAEALEGAIKTARKYHASQGHPERFHIVTFTGAFHGRTYATIAAGGNDKYIEGFGPKAPGFDRVAWGDVEEVKAAIGPQTAAILVEPIQGEGGIRVPPEGFLRALRSICDEHGLLLIADEVQCGVGRTGKLFAYEWSGIEPDIMAIARASAAASRSARSWPRERRARAWGSAPTAAPSAATRWPWRSATPCSTSCWPTASWIRSPVAAPTSSAGCSRSSRGTTTASSPACAARA